MKNVKAASYNVEFGSLIESNFSNFLKEKYSNSKKIIFVDDNTHEHCLDYLITNFEELENAEIILLPAGEENKVMEVCFQVWEALSEYKISRKDLIINLGGGVVCDMGGFIASIFKRGIDFIHIPTTLLAMVDASVGGKTGIDLGRYKNQLGVFANPQAIYIDPCLLQTLEEKELKNGLAEMLKHGLIMDKNHWEKVKNIDVKEITLENILHSVEIKNNVVLADPKESGERKKLNFGHTFGHAFEGFLLHSEEQIAHGHAVALGIICESYLSHQKGYLKEEELNEICEVITDKFQLLAFQEDDFNALYELMLQDKKNAKQVILAVMLTSIGDSIVDVPIDQKEVFDALNFLLKKVSLKK